jgi:hypothetical protein
MSDVGLGGTKDVLSPLCGRLKVAQHLSAGIGVASFSSPAWRTTELGNGSFAIPFQSSASRTTESNNDDPSTQVLGYFQSSAKRTEKI